MAVPAYIGYFLHTGWCGTVDPMTLRTGRHQGGILVRDLIIEDLSMVAELI